MGTPNPHPEPHELLFVFPGGWYAEGSNYGGEDQSPENPHAEVTPWTSVHAARWHSGGYFIVQDERANGPFDTLAVLGWDVQDERYFARTFENHGFSRDYTLSVADRTWRFTGEIERAMYAFSEDESRQENVWEWKRNDHWLPLCETNRAPYLMNRI